MTTLTNLDRLAKAATPGPYNAVVVDQCEPVAPDIWRVHGHDDSYEATICECWSGEHDNKAMAEYFAALSPERVLAMLDVIEAAKVMNQEYQRGKYDARTNSAFKDALTHLEVT